MFNFNAEVREIFDAAGNVIPAELGRGVYRDDTDELMSICGPIFKPVQHDDIVTPIYSTLEAKGYKLEDRNTLNRGSLYDLAGKSGAFVSEKLTDNGAVMRTDIILGDFIKPTGRSSYLQAGEDLNFFKISVLNSHNGKFAARVNTSYLRLICMNGMTSPNFQAGTYGKHTLNFNADGMIRQIENSVNMMDEDADRFGRMASTRIDAVKAKEMLKLTLAKLPNKSNGEAHFSKPLLNKILGQFAREDQTVWGLYNAVTWWQTHADRKEGSNALTTTVSREQQVAKMLKSKAWREVEFAI